MVQPLHTLELPARKMSSGKVREIYEFDDDLLLLVTTDRLSAFDVILPDPIPHKGNVLNQMSLFWFGFFQEKVKNAIVEDWSGDLPWERPVSDETMQQISGRIVLMKKASVFPVECIVRGYLAGSGFKDYKQNGAISGHLLPEGLKMAEKLPHPIFTPSTKATSGHDENISVNQVADLLGTEITARLEDLSMMIYSEAAEYALEKGIIIADTKFEFGMLDGEMVLIDEVLTPDSSRFWPADRVVVGQNPPSYDKQIVRNWLEQSGWNKQPPAPKLPEEIIKQTSEAYLDIFQKLTGKKMTL